MYKNSVEVCFSPVLFPLFAGEDKIVVVIDVLRATSAICTAIHYGVEKIIPVATIEEALQFKAKGFLAGAERNAEKLEGFDLGNSPYGYMNPELKGKSIVLTTTNGTQAIEVAKDSACVVLGSFLNLNVLSEWISWQKKDVVLLCAGWKNKFNLEDSLFAGAVAENLFKTGRFSTMCDSALASVNLYSFARKDLYAFLETSSHRQRLERLDLEKDVRYCLQLDQAPVIPVLREGSLINLSLQEAVS